MMAWPDHYDCPECGGMITRPHGANVWGCLCHRGKGCQCRFLDAVACYRCGNADGFPRHAIPMMTDAALNRSVLLSGDQGAWERGYTVKELNEKRRVYCDRCIHEQFFLLYSDSDILCRLCGVRGPRGATLEHQQGIVPVELNTRGS